MLFCFVVEMHEKKTFHNTDDIMRYDVKAGAAAAAATCSHAGFVPTF